MQAEFLLDDLIYPYADYPYNNTRTNERAVEVAVGLAMLDGAVLEVGAVLPHYLSSWPRPEHTVIDLYEEFPGVCNEDVLRYDPDQCFDTIISISTVDHLQDGASVLAAISRMKSWLAPGGYLFVTAPHGQFAANGEGPPELDDLITGNQLEMTKILRMDKVDPARHTWEERPLSDPPLAYGTPTNHAHTVYLMFYEKDGQAIEISDSIPGNASSIRQIPLADIETVQAHIREKYGIEVTPEYAADFIAFMDEM